MIKIREVFEHSVKYKADKDAYAQPQMRARKTYGCRECLLNPDYIVAAYPHSFEGSIDQEMLQDNFSDSESFSRVILDGNSFRSSEIIVDMSFEELSDRLL